VGGAVSHRTIRTAKWYAEVARDAEQSGQYRSAARLYMRAVLVLTGMLPATPEAVVDDVSPPASHTTKKPDPRR
jgi:hypothetical protein